MPALLCPLSPGNSNSDPKRNHKIVLFASMTVAYACGNGRPRRHPPLRRARRRLLRGTPAMKKEGRPRINYAQKRRAALVGPFLVRWLSARQSAALRTDSDRRSSARSSAECQAAGSWTQWRDEAAARVDRPCKNCAVRVACVIRDRVLRNTERPVRRISRRVASKG